MALRYHAGFLSLVLATFLTSFGCEGQLLEQAPAHDLANFAHLERLSEDIVVSGDTLRIVHIYSEHPDYEWVGDEDEGIACVDDAARAAVLYLRRYELTRSDDVRRAAEKLIRFLFAMQSENGLFYNFVMDNQLTINSTHQNSLADQLNWWTARATWALGTCAKVLQGNPIAAVCEARAQRVLPHVKKVLQSYGETIRINGRIYPTWLVHEYAADATSELLLGLIPLNEVAPDPALAQAIDRLSDGIVMMQHGTFEEAPYGAHLSWRETWHAWGSAQTQALAVAGKLESARTEAEQFYSRLLVHGWVSELQLGDQGSVKEYPQIAYGARCVVAGLAALYEQTGDERWAVYTGLAAGWFFGNNSAGISMYDPQTGRGYDGLNGLSELNVNSGAESTIEALMAIQEVDQIPTASRWLHAIAEEPVVRNTGGQQVTYRVFSPASESEYEAVTIFVDHTSQTVDLLTRSELETIMDKQ